MGSGEVLMPIQLPTIQEHKAQWESCIRCKIGCLANKKVFYRTEGKKPTILFIGEAPGKTEDKQGQPFVGRSGILLQRMIEEASFEAKCDVPSYKITNMVLCRPTDMADGPNRAPTQEEILNCRPRLEQFISMVSPKGIITLGATARDNLPSFSLEDRNYIHLCHPAYLLRSGGPKSVSFHREVSKLSKFLKAVLCGV